MPLKSRLASWVCACCTVVASQSLYAQGFGRGGGNPDEFFNRIDTNGNQQLDPEELQNSPMRRMLEAGGRDLSKPITKAEFTEMTQQFMQRFRGGGGMRISVGGPPGAPGGSPPETPPAPPTGSATPAPPAAPTAPAGSPAPATPPKAPGGESAPKPASSRPRSASLPEEYASKDTNGDGQLGLYEWPRTDFATFQKLDLNNDGFVTAAELTRKDKPRATQTASRPTPAIAMGGTGAPPATGGGRGDAARAESSRGDNGGDAGGRGGGDRSRRGGGGPGRGSMPPAERAFTALDIDKNGSLSEDEWQRSVSVKAQFEREGISLTFPVSKADFESKYPQRR